MSELMFQILYPIWIGIGVNIMASIVNMLSMGSRAKWVRLWLDHQWPIIGIIWAALLVWSSFNALTFK